MSGFTVHTGNHLEVLAERLAERLKRPTAEPLASQRVIVQSRGMARWLSMEIARRNRVCANVFFPFPNAFLHELSMLLIPECPAEDRFDVDTLTLRVYEHLPNWVEDSEFSALRRYLETDATGLKRYQLCRQIAVLFDQYQIFRPEWLLDWERGRRLPDSRFRWQSSAWRFLSAETGGDHRVRRYRDLLGALRKHRQRPAGMPDRISVFGISYLPPLYLEIFSELARIQKIDLYLLNPCREFWGDIVSGAEAERLKRRYAAAAEGIPVGIQETAGKWLYLEAGNRLLASMGLQGREFLGLIQNFEMTLSEAFSGVDRDSLLHRVQGDILHLKDPAISVPQPFSDAKDESGTVPDPVGKSSNAGSDGSIRLHACHGPMREVEVLHDQLLSMFEELPNLNPRDVLVMTSDIENYAPYIHAVFGSQADSRRQIPFRVTDRPPIAGNRAADGFFQMLGAGENRQGVGDVLAMLENELVADRFEILPPDLWRIRKWIYESGIRWGVDVEDLVSQGLPASGENTWKAGLDRMLAGYALSGASDDLLDGILPFTGVEGSDAALMDRLLCFLDRYFFYLKLLNKQKNIDNWISLSKQILEDMLDGRGAAETEIQTVRFALDELERQARRADSRREMEPAAFRALIRERLESNPISAGFIAGGVTFCAMLPMRSIPFRVICLLGMNSGEFPREDRRPEFDLMAGDPRPGDRSRRNDDKYLFLEALISARDVFYVSYTGQSERDNTDLPPSVLVSELIDYLRDGYGMSQEKLVTRQRLHPFSAEYYRVGSRLFSYDRDNLRAGNSQADPADAAPFITSALDWPADGSWKQIGIDDFCRFFRNPSRFFLQQRLGAALQGLEASPPDRENFSLDGLDRYRLEQKILTAMQNNVPEDRLLSVCRETGLLPHGVVGDVAFRRARMEVFGFIEKIRSTSFSGTSDGIEIDVAIDDIRLRGRIDGFSPDGLVTVRYAKQRTVDLLSSWIRHLAVCCHLAPVREIRSFLYCKDRYCIFQTPENPLTFMEKLVALYRLGICAPLPFFPRAAMAYIRQMQKQPPDEKAARDAARRSWEGSEFAQGELQDVDFNRCFGMTDPIGPDFAETAAQVYVPMLAHRIDRKW